MCDLAIWAIKADKPQDIVECRAIESRKTTVLYYMEAGREVAITCAVQVSVFQILTSAKDDTSFARLATLPTWV